MKEPSPVRRTRTSRIYQKGKGKTSSVRRGGHDHQDCTVLSTGTRAVLSGSPRPPGAKRKANFPRHHSYGFIGHSTVPPLAPSSLLDSTGWYSSNHAHTLNSGAIHKPKDSSRCEHVSLSPLSNHRSILPFYPVHLLFQYLVFSTRTYPFILRILLASPAAFGPTFVFSFFFLFWGERREGMDSPCTVRPLALPGMGSIGRTAE